MTMASVEQDRVPRELPGGENLTSTRGQRALGSQGGIGPKEAAMKRGKNKQGEGTACKEALSGEGA